MKTHSAVEHGSKYAAEMYGMFIWCVWRDFGVCFATLYSYGGVVSCTQLHASAASTPGFTASHSRIPEPQCHSQFAASGYNTVYTV